MKGCGANQDVETFCTKIISAEAHGLEPTAWHEAGHALIWKYLFPDDGVHYSIENGYPCVIPDKGKAAYVIAQMKPREAAKMALYKLGGFAAEMIFFGVSDEEALRAIAAFIERDTAENVKKPRFDWDEDAKEGGDIPVAVVLLQRAGLEVRHGLELALRDCINAINANREIFDAEVNEVTAMLDAWNAANNIKPM